MLSAKLGHFLDTPLGFIAKRIPVSPNSLTVTGFFLTLAAAFEWYERGIITKEDTDGIPLEWGNVEAQIGMLMLKRRPGGP